MCFEAGTDTSCEYSSSSDIPGASAEGLLKWPTVDRALRRLYQGLVRAGYFDGAKSPHASLGWSDVNKLESQELALRVAAEGIVLLKNDGTLPLRVCKTRAPRVAMIGFWADAPDKLSGGYSGTPAFMHSPVFAARQMGWNVTTALGPVLEGSSANDSWTAAALEAAKNAEHILYFGGLDTSAAGETKDRNTINWPSAQLDLIKKLGELGKPLVVVQLGDQIDDTPVLETKEVNAIMWANWPGQDGGTAVMQLISGKKSPAGRLPVTQYPASYAEVPLTDMNLRPTGSLPGRTYRWYPNAVKPFGFGLHYTTFKTEVDKPVPHKVNIKDLLHDCRSTYRDTCPLPPLSVHVHNTGKRASDYVALAFISGAFGPKPYPIKTLVSYARLRDILPGKKDTARLEWTLGNLARYDEYGNTVLYPGEYTLTLDEPTQTTVTFTLEGEAVVLDQWPSPPS
jgi:beta-D-xylosidase 4